MIYPDRFVDAVTTNPFAQPKDELLERSTAI